MCVHEKDLTAEKVQLVSDEHCPRHKRITCVELLSYWFGLKTNWQSVA